MFSAILGGCRAFPGAQKNAIDRRTIVSVSKPNACFAAARRQSQEFFIEPIQRPSAPAEKTSNAFWC